MNRRLLMIQDSGFDTSPVILEYNKRWSRGKLVVDNGYNATIIYPYTASSSGRKLVYSGLSIQLDIFQDNVYIDYWSTRNGTDIRNVLNANSNGIAVTILTSELDNAYAYIPDTGEILFAGRNSIYYGHRNISELE